MSELEFGLPKRVPCCTLAVYTQICCVLVTGHTPAKQPVLACYKSSVLQSCTRTGPGMLQRQGALEETCGLDAAGQEVLEQSQSMLDTFRQKLNSYVKLSLT